MIYYLFIKKQFFLMQEFFIKQYSTLPILKVVAVNDGRFDYDGFNEAIQDANIYFTMTNAYNSSIKLSRGKCYLKLVDPDSCKEEYAICYHWNKRDTNEKGKFIGTFSIEFNGNLTSPGKDYPSAGDKLIVPLKEDIVIHVV